jgi:glyoxylase-like metal-dependent hydrolase (beta-lactamase superfamily II)/rhodanese-related sulfurtransferase
VFIKQINPISCKTYLIANGSTKELAFVDPVLSGLEEYLKIVEELRAEDDGWKLTAVVDTHTHADHISGAAALKDYTDCNYVMHENSRQQCVDVHVSDGQEIELAGIRAKILHSPGHTKDSISLIIEDGGQTAVFTGDALFLDDGGAGRDDLPGGDPGEHYDTLQRLKALNEDLIVLPGHDYRERIPSNLRHQKKTNPWLKDQSKNDYVEFIDDLKLGRADWMVDVLAANYKCSRDPNAAFVPAESPACEVQGTIGQNVDAIEVEPITVQEVKGLLSQGESPLLLDVRDASELQGDLGHLDGVKNISIVALQRDLDALSDWKNKPIITICRSGHRAATASKILKNAGFNDVKTMIGGMLAWHQCAAA